MHAGRHRTEGDPTTVITASVVSGERHLHLSGTLSSPRRNRTSFRAKKLECEGHRTCALDEPSCSNVVRNEPSAQSPTHQTAVQHQQPKSAKPNKTFMHDNFLFSPSLHQVCSPGRITSCSCVLVLKPLAFSSAESDISFTAEPSHKFVLDMA